MKNKYVLSFVVVVVFGVICIFFIQGNDIFVNTESSPIMIAEDSAVTPTGVEHKIVLTETGYEPSEIIIQAGDTIVFSVDSAYGNLHWPASNLHPTHREYSEFDPLKPIEPDATWSFTFGKKGEWRFHDHLRPYNTGVITVE